MCFQASSSNVALHFSDSVCKKSLLWSVSTSVFVKTSTALIKTQLPHTPNLHHNALSCFPAHPPTPSSHVGKHRTYHQSAGRQSVYPTSGVPCCTTQVSFNPVTHRGIHSITALTFSFVPILDLLVIIKEVRSTVYPAQFTARKQQCILQWYPGYSVYYLDYSVYFTQMMNSPQV